MLNNGDEIFADMNSMAGIFWSSRRSFCRYGDVYFESLGTDRQGERRERSVENLVRVMGTFSKKAFKSGG